MTPGAGSPGAGSPGVGSPGAGSLSDGPCETGSDSQGFRTGGADGRRPTYLIPTPYDDESTEFIRTIMRHFGLRPICVHFDEKAKAYGEYEHPVLTSDLIEGAVLAERNDVHSAVMKILDRYDVLGVVPFQEDTVEIAADLCEVLDLDWNAPSTLRRFRNKFEMRSHVETTSPHVRVARSLRITTAGELAELALPDRFVIKPNDGFGNMSIGIFGVDELDAAVRHVETGPDVEWLIEEYVGGTEYHVNGQIRRDGTIELLAIFEYVRGEVAGYPTVYLAEIQVHTDEDPFAEIAEYATELLAALGLRSCPFHLEVKVDENGPCLIDLGARMASESTGSTLTRLHPHRPSAYAVAANDYLSLDLIPALPARWDHHDRTRAVVVYGIAEKGARLASLSGEDAVEALPEFVRWCKRATIGEMIDVTTDLGSAPWIVEVEGDLSRQEALALADRIRSTIVLNPNTEKRYRVVARASDILRRARRAARARYAQQR